MLLFILYLCYNIFIPQIFYTLINHYFYSNYMLYILYFYYINTIICYIYELFYVPLCVISYIIPVKYSICYTILAKYPICLCEISYMPVRNILYASAKYPVCLCEIYYIFLIIIFLLYLLIFYVQPIHRCLLFLYYIYEN